MIAAPEDVVVLDRRSPLTFREALRAQPLGAAPGQRGRVVLATFGAAGVAASKPAEMLLAADLTATVITTSQRSYGAG